MFGNAGCIEKGLKFLDYTILLIRVTFYLICMYSPIKYFILLDVVRPIISRIHTLPPYYFLDTKKLGGGHVIYAATAVKGVLTWLPLLTGKKYAPSTREEIGAMFIFPLQNSSLNTLLNYTICIVDIILKIKTLNCRNLQFENNENACLPIMRPICAA